ncbi:tRNA pseudouridine(55) synthase TruB [Candidatus Uhrbacteria bacterium RIFCSPHIGHO2_02_FULL_60_10]|uniref:tRNA pseudouridine synthase B n=1 Tax=Candidatus Uhrbacteria bacterium RIFCSPHIGHO2_02_FULL_60_10 TaxID=1802392 RepID=A0A1F7U9X7_9BACT|nr:MAG: tRNA pseudouridine(55) synthase TruB [Candidatus Uhrbacteria bacterium RIFCSPHIGHO2_02_FULL_60_10]
MTSGFLLIDKPAGITSHDVVDRLRRVTGERRIGHAGTLDPFATGLLIVGVGREATKRLGEIMGQDKEYEATLAFCGTSDTQDLTGCLTPVPGAVMPTEEQIRLALPRFTGRIRQVPPMYSAKKIAGRKLYELARAGQEVVRQPVAITVHHWAVLDYRPPYLRFAVRCSSGTYIRTLANDLGEFLACGAYLTMLRRTAIGSWQVADAAELQSVTPDNWRGKIFDLPPPDRH